LKQSQAMLTPGMPLVTEHQYDPKWITPYIQPSPMPLPQP